MTVAGIVLILIGMGIALFAEDPFNGQWLLGFLFAIGGVALAARHTFNTREKK